MRKAINTMTLLYIMICTSRVVAASFYLGWGISLFEFIVCGNYMTSLIRVDLSLIVVINIGYICLEV